MIITLDGPAGVGKSTLAKRLAQELGFFYLDSGALYRAVTWKALQAQIDLQDEAALVTMLQQCRIECREQQVLVDGVDVTQAIREERISRHVPLVAQNPAVREYMLPIFRQQAHGRNIVAEGRDLGSVVFPDAAVKFYMDASLPERAQRRYRELVQKGRSSDLQAVLADLEERDRRDRERSVAPLVCPSGAIVVDTTDKSIEQVLAILQQHVQAAKVDQQKSI